MYHEPLGGKVPFKDGVINLPYGYKLGSYDKTRHVTHSSFSVNLMLIWVFHFFPQIVYKAISQILQQKNTK